MLWTFLAFLDYHDSNAGKGLVIFQSQYSLKSRTLPITTLTEQIKPLVIENLEFDWRDLSKLEKVWHSRTIVNLTQGTCSTNIKSSSTSERESSKMKLWSKNLDRWLRRIMSWNTDILTKLMADVRLSPTSKTPTQGKTVNIFNRKILCNKWSMENLIEGIRLFVTEKRRLYLVMNHN